MSQQCSVLLYSKCETTSTSTSNGTNQQLSQSTTINGSTDISDDDDDDDDDDDTVCDHGLHPSMSSSSPLLTPYPCARDCALTIYEYNEI
jgi:hypothetical protein